jgi:hypothetical protein
MISRIFFILVLFLGICCFLLEMFTRRKNASFLRLIEGNWDSGNHLKSGRFTPEWVAGLARNARQVYSGIGGRFAPDFPRKYSINSYCALLYVM